MKKSVVRKLSNWIKENDFDCKVKEEDLFSYDLEENIVYVSHEEPDHFNEYYNFCIKNNLSKEVNWETLCFLHELGHNETAFTLTNFEIIIDNLRSILETTSLTYVGANIKRYLYFRLPAEKAATLWAIDYINNNDLTELNSILL